MRVRAGVDQGGTFTDFVAFDEDGHLHVAKTLSTPHDPAQAIFDATSESNLDPRDIEFLIHGTTVATNALLERKGAKVGLLSTLGFRDILAIQRTTRPSHFDLEWIKTASLVPRNLRRGVRERVLYSGEVQVPLDEDQLRGEVAYLRDQGVEAVAVAYLFSFMNPEHERRTRKIISEVAPDMLVSISSDVLPKWGEFERTSTTVIDAYLKPLVNRHAHSLRKSTADAGIKRLLVVQSNGGALTTERTVAGPVRIVRSGPAGGIIATSFVGKLTGEGHLIAADMGGTSFEASFLPHGAPAFTASEEIEFGIPIALNVIDVRAIGAGGGSIARIDDAGILRVGPQSAGSFPGPACYGRGGTEATITDANVVLGRMVDAFPLGGSLKLDAEASRAVVGVLAERLGMSIERVAQGILNVAANSMAQAIRLVTVDRGHDPRVATLVPYGGAGPMHACELARALQIKRILIPRYPGAFSALGALIAETRCDYRQTLWMPKSKLDISRINDLFDGLERRAAVEFKDEGFDVAPDITRSVEMRYVGQNFELEVPVRGGLLDLSAMDEVLESFHTEHERLYGYSIRNHEVEILNFGITAAARHAPFTMPKIAAGGPVEPVGEAMVYYADSAEPKLTKLYDRRHFGHNTTVHGPAIIGQLDATTLLEEGATARVDEYGNMLVTFKGE